MPSIGKQEHARQSQTSAREASIATENLESSKDTTDENDDNDPWKAVMGGSVRGLLLMLFKKISLKAVLKKKAFLTIGGTAESGTESNFVSKKMKTSFLHSRAVGKRCIQRGCRICRMLLLTRSYRSFSSLLLPSSLCGDIHDGDGGVWYL
jgi:hypothetical protein